MIPHLNINHRRVVGFNNQRAQAVVEFDFVNVGVGQSYRSSGGWLDTPSQRAGHQEDAGVVTPSEWGIDCQLGAVLNE